MRIVSPAWVLDARTEKGAALLDEKMPGWVDMIDLDDLVLCNPTQCILGQVGLCVLGDALPYNLMLDFLGGDDRHHAFASDHGFDLWDTEDRPAQWEVLEKAWYTRIMDRRLAR